MDDPPAGAELELFPELPPGDAGLPLSPVPLVWATVEDVPDPPDPHMQRHNKSGRSRHIPIALFISSYLAPVHGEIQGIQRNGVVSELLAR